MQTITLSSTSHFPSSWSTVLIAGADTDPDTLPGTISFDDILKRPGGVSHLSPGGLFGTAIDMIGDIVLVDYVASYRLERKYSFATEDTVFEYRQAGCVRIKPFFPSCEYGEAGSVQYRKISICNTVNVECQLLILRNIVVSLPILRRLLTCRQQLKSTETISCLQHNI